MSLNKIVPNYPEKIYQSQFNSDEEERVSTQKKVEEITHALASYMEEIDAKHSIDDRAFDAKVKEGALTIFDITVRDICFGALEVAKEKISSKAFSSNGKEASSSSNESSSQPSSASPFFASFSLSLRSNVDMALTFPYLSHLSAETSLEAVSSLSSICSSIKLLSTCRCSEKLNEVLQKMENDGKTYQVVILKKAKEAWEGMFSCHKPHSFKPAENLAFQIMQAKKRSEEEDSAYKKILKIGEEGTLEQLKEALCDPYARIFWLREKAILIAAVKNPNLGPLSYLLEKLNTSDNGILHSLLSEALQLNPKAAELINSKRIAMMEKFIKELNLHHH